MHKISQYCQKCRAGNEPGEMNCRLCGTRLMLVVFPPSTRHDDGIVPSFYEDHLLERVTMLELRLTHALEQLAIAYEFIGGEIKSFQKDHVLLESFLETLKKVNPELGKLINQNCLEIFGDKNEKLVLENKQEQILKEILNSHDNKQLELFTHLIKESQVLLEKNEEKQAFLTLERALLLSPKNVSLLMFVAEHLFRTDKFILAEKNLEKAFELAPQNEKVLLLLGVIYADQAEAEKARRLLSVLVNQPEKNVCVNYIWGMLAAFEENWSESIAAFRQALEISEAAELYYLIGCAFFQLSHPKFALQNLQKAISLDAQFADAWFMQSIIYRLSGNAENAEKAVRAAMESKEAGAQCLEYLNQKKTPDTGTALPFLHFKNSGRQLLTKGSRRLSKFFRERIYQAIE